MQIMMAWISALIIYVIKGESLIDPEFACTQTRFQSNVLLERSYRPRMMNEKNNIRAPIEPEDECKL
jgi:hypothetical protein